MVIEFVNGDRVVFVDDRDYLIGQEDLEGVDYVLQATGRSTSRVIRIWPTLVW